MRISEAFNSMLRTDYISLNDLEKLSSLAEYYVDYFGYLPQILAKSDQLIVGRRGNRQDHPSLSCICRVHAVMGRNVKLPD